MNATTKAIVLGLACVWAWCDTPPSISVQTWADRTAIYPGDKFHYIVRVEHSPDIEVVTGRVQKDQLSLDPFQILNIASASGSLPVGREYFEMRLLLTTYATGNADLAIPSFSLFYFHRQQLTAKDNPPAETLVVPPLTLGLRTTIVDPGGDIRERKSILPTRGRDWLLPGIAGLFGLFAVLAWGGWQAIAWARSGFWKRRTIRTSRQKSLQESYQEIRKVAADSPENIEIFYSKASAILRRLAGEHLGECGGLTPRETVDALRGAGDNQDHASALGDLMEECDLVRYSPDGAIRAQARHSDFVRKFEELVERH